MRRWRAALLVAPLVAAFVPFNSASISGSLFVSVTVFRSVFCCVFIRCVLRLVLRFASVEDGPLSSWLAAFLVRVKRGVTVFLLRRRYTRSSRRGW